MCLFIYTRGWGFKFVYLCFFLSVSWYVYMMEYKGVCFNLNPLFWLVAVNGAGGAFVFLYGGVSEFFCLFV